MCWYGFFFVVSDYLGGTNMIAMWIFVGYMTFNIVTVVQTWEVIAANLFTNYA